jgi:hypothetical protein
MHFTTDAPLGVMAGLPVVCRGSLCIDHVLDTFIVPLESSSGKLREESQLLSKEALLVHSCDIIQSFAVAAATIGAMSHKSSGGFEVGNVEAQKPSGPARDALLPSKGVKAVCALDTMRFQLIT